MAFIEIVPGYQGLGEDRLNVDDRVGLYKANSIGDIILVQALLKYTREGNGDIYPVYLPEYDRLPMPDGNFRQGDPNFQLNKWILNYQKHRNSFFKSVRSTSRLTEDGVISKAKGTHTMGTGKKFTIVELNEDAHMMYLARHRSERHGYSYIKFLQEIYPILNIALLTGEYVY